MLCWYVLFWYVLRWYVLRWYVLCWRVFFAPVRFLFVRFALVRFVLVRFVLVRFALVRFVLVRIVLVCFAKSSSAEPCSSLHYRYTNMNSNAICASRDNTTRSSNTQPAHSCEQEAFPHSYRQNIALKPPIGSCFPPIGNFRPRLLWVLLVDFLNISKVLFWHVNGSLLACRRFTFGMSTVRLAWRRNLSH